MKDLEKDLIETIEAATLTVLPKWFIATTYEFQAEELNYLLKEELDLGKGLILYGKGGAIEKCKLSAYVVRVGMQRRIHGKVIIGRGKGGVFLAVGSANLTRAGIEGGNIEIFNVIVNPPFQLMHSAAKWLLKRLQMLPHKPSPEWESKIEALIKDSSVNMSDSNAKWFDNDSTSIAAKIKEHIGRRHVEQLTVVSPYLNGSAIKQLAKDYTLNPTAVKIILPSERHKEGRIVEQMDYWKNKGRLFQFKDDERFPHAKIFLFNFLNGGLLVYGSANATQAGLFSKVNGQKAMAECAVGIRLNKKELQAFQESMLCTKIPETDKLEPNKIEDNDVESDISDLTAWYKPLDGIIEIWPPESSDIPVSPPEIYIEGLKKKYILKSKSGNSFIFGDEKVNLEFKESWPANDDVSIKWGRWRGEVYWLDKCEDNQEDPIEALWGGNEQPGDGAGGGGGKRDVHNSTNNEPPRAELDEYEKRSLRVVKNIWEDLSADYPSLDMLKTFEKHLNLGCRLDDKILDGCSFFLWTRLLARCADNRFGKPLHPQAQIALKAIIKTTEALRKKLFKTKARREFNKWQHSNMWLERAKRPKEANL